MGRPYQKSLDERIKEAIADANLRKFKEKRRYKTSWETAKNRRKLKAARHAAVAEHRETVDAAINARRAFELKYADVGFIGHVSPAKIKREVPKLKQPRWVKSTTYLTKQLWRHENRDVVNARRREQRRAAKEAKKAAMQKKEESTT